MQEILNEINWAIITPFLIIQAILIIVALMDWVKADQTNGPKGLWLIIIICISIFGPIGYFIFGRRQD